VVIEELDGLEKGKKWIEERKPDNLWVGWKT
jgi:hypothetical protein